MTQGALLCNSVNLSVQHISSEWKFAETSNLEQILMCITDVFIFRQKNQMPKSHMSLNFASATHYY